MANQSPWSTFSAFQVFGDHVPMDGFSLVLRLVADARSIERVVEGRAKTQTNLDPALAQAVLRSSLGLITTGMVSFVYANVEETLVVIRREVVQEVGQSLEVHDRLVSAWAARMALIVGQSVPVVGRVYEFPDIGVVGKALQASVDTLEEQTPLRTARRLGAQLRGRGQAFHESMLETLEEQTSLLESHGVDMDSLPTWWWRGVAAKLGNAAAGEVELWSELPPTADLVAQLS